MKIYRPLKTNWRTQEFGANLACVKTNDYGVPIRPFEVIKGIYPQFCPENSTKFYPALGYLGHNGVDLACYYAEPIYHSGDFEGYMKTEIDPDGGIGVDVFADKEDSQGRRFKLRYWHLKSVVGFDNKPIKPGDLIGYGDSTGASSGNHLHFSLKEVDAFDKTLNKTNGYAGAVDMAPYFVDEFILDYLKQTESTIIRLLQKYIDLLIKYIELLKVKQK